MSISIRNYPNDFKIVYEQSYSELPITALYLFCDVGSAHEYDKMRGASHFIEHMCFKGTQKMPQSKEIFKEYSKIGAYFNAYTTKRYTCFTIKCQDDYIQHCLNILSDMLTNSIFNEREFNKEEKVVIEENNNNDNDPESVINDVTDRIIYAGSSYEFPVDCLDYHTKKTLAYKDVVEFYHSYYFPGNMLLSVVSGQSFKNIENSVKKTLFLKPRKLEQQGVIRAIQHHLIPQTGIEYRLIKKRGVTNVHINIGFRVCGRNTLDRHALTLLEKIMGEGLDGRIMTVLREKKGLVYGAKTYTNFYEYSGEFVFSTKTKAENLKKVLPLLVSIIKDMITHGITREELKTAKGNFKGNVLLELQDIVTQAQHNGEEMLFSGAIVPYQDIFETFIEPLTVKNMNDMIQRYFTNQNMCVCILSEKLPSLEIVQKACARII